MHSSALHVTRWGHSGPKVILIHGSAQGSDAGGDRHFSAQRQLAEMGWEVLVPDRPGHGQSVSPGRPDDATLDAQMIASLLGEGAHVVGHSFGGCVALALAAAHPTKVLSLTLIEPGMQKFAMAVPEVRRFGLRMLSILLLTWSAESRARKFNALVGVPVGVAGEHDSKRMRRIGKGIFRMRIPTGPALQRQLSAVAADAVPLLVVTGGWNPAFEATADLVAKAGNGRRIIVRSTDHFPHLVSDEFNRTLDAFMRAALPPQRRASQ